VTSPAPVVRPRAWALLLALVLGATWWIDVVHWHGMAAGVVDAALVELRVHRTVNAWSWVGFIQPPGFSLLLHALDGLERAVGLSPALGVFLLGAVVDSVLLAVLSTLVARRFGLHWGLLTAGMLALNPATLRPFEHYPLAQLLATLGVLVVVAAGRGRRSPAAAAAVVLLGSLIHLATLFVTLPVVVAVFVARPERRRGLLSAGAVAGALLLASTFPDFWIQLQEESVSTLPPGGPNIGWSNPLLVGLLGLWFVPALRGPDRWAAWGPTGFAAIIAGLQAGGLVNGVPFPSGMHYFTIVDPLLVLSAVVVVARIRPAAIRGGFVVLLGVTQAALFARAAVVLWGDPGVLLRALGPWRWFGTIPGVG